VRFEVAIAPYIAQSAAAQQHAARACHLTGGGAGIKTTLRTWLFNQRARK
jgi:hypothetical protein